MEDDENVYLNQRFPGSEKKSQLYKIKNSEKVVKFSRDNAFTFLEGFTLEKNDVLFKPFKKVIQRLFEAGILEKYPGKNAVNVNKENNIKIHDTQKKLVNLSLTHLQAGFVIWLSFVMIAIVSFFGEIFHHQFKLRIRGRVQKQIEKLQKIKMISKTQRKMRKIEPMKRDHV